jgi:hydroxymethylbilane synthase
VGGKRLFVKELEDALLRDEIDVAVHSAKDMPAALPEDLAVAATLPREDPRDALVLPSGSPGGSMAAALSQLGDGRRIGTSSIRRSAQLRRLVGGAIFTPVRGNVDTRLRKLDQGEYDALVLAAAGMRRLGLGERISAALPVQDCVPAPGQGIIALEIRRRDNDTADAVRSVHDDYAATALDAERAVVAALGGGCQLPLGAVAMPRGDDLELHAIVCSTDGARSVRACVQGARTAAAALGQRAADQLAAQGAVEILEEVRRTQGPVEGSY